MKWNCELYGCSRTAITEKEKKSLVEVFPAYAGIWNTQLCKQCALRVCLELRRIERRIKAKLQSDRAGHEAINKE